MPVVHNSTLLNSKCSSVKELYEIHQLNPMNNGVNTIDTVLSIDVPKQSLCMGNLTSIRYEGQRPVCLLNIKDVGVFTIPLNAQLLVSEDGIWGSVQDRRLIPGGKVGIYNHDTIEFHSIVNITHLPENYISYTLKVANRHNYVLDNGLIVHED